jgi:diacylglycerol kinase (ATP)
MTNLRKIIASIRHSIRGFNGAYRRDKSIRLEVHWGIPAFLVVGWVLAPLAFWEVAILLWSYLNILRTELLNTGIEFALDHLHPGEHVNIGRAKDTASAAVLVAFLEAACAVVVVWAL